MVLRREKKFSPLRGANKSWWRRTLIENWSLRLLALAITLVLWFMVSGRISEREIAVEPKLEGKPAPGFAVKEVVPTPAQIKVQGAIDKLDALDKAQTQPISIEGRRESFSVPQTAVYISDPDVEPLGRVNVRVTIVPTENSKPKSQDTN